MKKLFGGINMTWPKVIIFAIITAAFTALLNQVPFLKDTSFTDIAIYLDCWIFFAVIIMTNCKSALDSALKTFIFFFISQPLIYLIEVPFLGWSIMNYYQNWIIWTLLTFPMAYVGYYLKKDNLISLFIIAPVLVFLEYSGVGYLKAAIYDFPHHLLSAIFSIGTTFLYVFAIFSQKRERILGTLICIISVIIFIVPAFMNPRTYNTELALSGDELYFDYSYNVYLEDSAYGNVYIGTVMVGDDEEFAIKAELKKTGKTVVVLEDNNHNKKYFDLDIGNNTYTFKERK